MAGLGIEFNPSHTLDQAACVVTRGIPSGIDIALIRPILHALDSARRLFAPQEYHGLEELSEDGLQRRFFERWTEKEAWVKATDTGLSLP